MNANNMQIHIKALPLSFFAILFLFHLAAQCKLIHLSTVCADLDLSIKAILKQSVLHGKKYITYTILSKVFAHPSK